MTDNTQEEHINIIITNYLSQAKSITHLFFWSKQPEKKQLLKQLLKEELDSLDDKIDNQQKLVRKLLLDLTKPCDGNE